MLNIDPKEVAKFENIAERWWDLQGEFKPLHEINPLRLQFIQQYAVLNGKKILDIGCGGGILSESLARAGGRVTGIDLSNASLDAARAHQEKYPLPFKINYQRIAAEEFAQAFPAEFDIVTCMELLEHVPNPASLINACAQLVKPGGEVFFSTINRNPKAYLLAVIGAEYILNMLPKGTHDYSKFIRPSELANWARQVGLTVNELKGMIYQPFSKNYQLASDVSVNYLAFCKRDIS